MGVLDFFTGFFKGTPDEGTPDSTKAKRVPDKNQDATYKAIKDHGTTGGNGQDPNIKGDYPE